MSWFAAGLFLFVAIYYNLLTTLQHRMSDSLLNRRTVYLLYAIVAKQTYFGFVSTVYEFIETPEETGLDWIECRLNLYEQADKYFDDGGHAIEWALGIIPKK